MGFYLRDALNFGPFRINLSKSGVGVSVGARGLRIGTGPRGPYLHAGRDGLYYRAALGGRGPGHGAGIRELSSDEMVPLPMPTAAAMSHNDEPDMVQALNAGHAIKSIRSKLVGGLVVLSLVATDQVGPIALLGLIVTPLLWIIGGRIDRQRRMVAWSYDAAAVTGERYTKLVAAFDVVAAAEGGRPVVAGRMVNEGHDAKRHAGVAHLTDARSALLTRRCPVSLRCDLVPPALLMAGTNLYLMPDMMLVGDRTGYAAVPYDAITSRWDTRHYVERGPVPSDSEVVSYSWAHPNKDGGPDRRFAGNRKLPVCVNGIVHIARPDVFDVVLKLSSKDHLAAFVTALRAMGSSTEPASDLPPRADHADGLSLFQKALLAAEQATAAGPKALPPPTTDRGGNRPS